MSGPCLGSHNHRNGASSRRAVHGELYAFELGLKFTTET